VLSKPTAPDPRPHQSLVTRTPPDGPPSAKKVTQALSFFTPRQALMAVATQRAEAVVSGGAGGGVDPAAVAANARPSLVVCPASLVGHWVHEARRFFDPRIVDPVRFEGRKGEGAMDGRHLVVVSYHMMRRAVGAWRGLWIGRE
jgi:hypothetical protein